MRDIDTARMRDIADMDSRAGAPVGNALRTAADEIDRLRARLTEVEADHEDRLLRQTGLIARAAKAEAERDLMRDFGIKWVHHWQARAVAAETEIARLTVECFCGLDPTDCPKHGPAGGTAGDPDV